MPIDELSDPTPAFVTLAKRFGLTPFECDVLLLCTAIELDPQIAVLCARVQDDPQRSYPTFALALSVFDEPAWDVVSWDRPLRYWHLVEVDRRGGAPLTLSPLRADERVVNFIKGLNRLDDRIANIVFPLDIPGDDAPSPPSQRAVADSIVDRWRRSEAPPLPIVQLLGSDVPSKRRVAADVGSTLGRRFYRLTTDALPTQPVEVETLVRQWQRESMLLPIALFVDAQDVDGAGDQSGVTALRRFLDRCGGPALVAAREPLGGVGNEVISVDIAKPTPSEQRAAWEAVLGRSSGDVARALAGQFDLDVAAIDRIAHAVLADKKATGSPLATRLWDACRAALRPRLDALAQRIDAKATWADLVLPAEPATLLHRIADQVGQRHMVYEDWGFAAKMSRGFGITALFAGPSGVGKTMAAEVIADELRLTLYRIDLSAVVSKYIGETEKNLRRLFDAAEEGGAILFFDEADALFGKRSEVRDSHDRYANIEVNYLLQRMESFRGLAILATNAKSALDSAFVRRLRFIVDFPHPGVEERLAIWKHVFPSATPVDKALDYGRLAKLNATGGMIHNIALDAAFMAAKNDSRVTTPIVLECARIEFVKASRPIDESEFRYVAAKDDLA